MQTVKLKMNNGCIIVAEAEFVTQPRFLRYAAKDGDLFELDTHSGIYHQRHSLVLAEECVIRTERG